MSCCVLPVKLRMSGQLRVTVTGLIRTLFLFLLSVIPSHFLSAEYPRQPHTTSLSFLAHRPSDGCYPASPLPLAWNHLGLISAQASSAETCVIGPSLLSTLGFRLPKGRIQKVGLYAVASGNLGSIPASISLSQSFPLSFLKVRRICS